MKHYLTRTASLCVALSVALASPAALALDELDEDIFGVAPVEDEALAEMRGGFITVGGLQIDFALKSRTVINGQEMNNFILESANLDAISQANLQRVIEVGENNTFESIDKLMEIPGLVTLIGNTLNDATIQNFNELEVGINNFGEYQNNAPLDFAISTSRQVGLR